MNQKFPLNRKRGIHATISRKNVLKLNLLAYEFGSNPSKVLESLLNEAPEPKDFGAYELILQFMINTWNEDPDQALDRLISHAKTGKPISEFAQIV